MERSNSYSFHQQQQNSQTNHARYPTAHNSSSAFSASANPNEDWTKISDLAERRRIQNRIAQRNYRKKLKRRLEDLERKAASTSASPEPSHAELVVSSTERQLASSSSDKPLARQPSCASSTYSQDAQLSPELFPLEDPFANSTLNEEQFAYDSTPSYSYSNCVPSADYFASDFTFADAQTIPQIYSDSYFQPDYLHSLPPTLPSMGMSDGMKQDAFFTDDEMLNPFGIPYTSLGGMEMSFNQMQGGPQSRSSSTSDGWSSNDSRENSPPYFAHQPTTPLSRSTSPNIHFFEHGWQA